MELIHLDSLFIFNRQVEVSRVSKSGLVVHPCRNFPELDLRQLPAHQFERPFRTDMHLEAAIVDKHGAQLANPYRNRLSCDVCREIELMILPVF
ncbi:hypothetical protein CI1B_27330 [Bradyrhizobium ivorense]|uniref:Uncharacterized protein n=1 Tax=Bradyrhizobium ivorense TaxID=2511166 RepID=A0A508T8I2_9BRAD|nr:hypothetical protein CI1B_27330 [Bradyrhizobium ivorense]